MSVVVNCQMELPPGSTPFFAVFFDFPLTFTGNFQPGGINEALRGPQGKPEYMLNHQNSGDGEIRIAPGSSPEESPENKTGIVRCVLIDCANNFKAFITMPARSLCQNFLKNILAPLHLYRQKSLIATNAVINGASLTPGSIGRHLTGTASVKNKIKRVAQLLGNPHLQNEVSTIFQRITQKITRGMSRVVILIDRSAYHASRFQLLRASLACDGRSLPLMSLSFRHRRQRMQTYMSVFWNRLLSAFPPGLMSLLLQMPVFRGDGSNSSAPVAGPVFAGYRAIIITMLVTAGKRCRTQAQKHQRQQFI